MTVTAMLAGAAANCDVGVKRNAKGTTRTGSAISCTSTTADGEIPNPAVLTAASVHDSQLAIPLATITATRVTNLYDLMDSAYDDAENQTA